MAGGAGVDIGRPRNPVMAMQLTGPGMKKIHMFMTI